MVTSIVKFLLNVLQKHKIIETQIDIYKYGLELVISSFFCILISVIAGILCNCLFETVFFLSCFIIIRLCSGGFHASTHLGCWSTMLAVTLIHIFIIKQQCFPFFPLIILDCLSLITIFIFSPVENFKKPILKKSKNKLKLLSFAISILYFSVAIILGNINNIAITLHYVNITDALLILIEEVRK